VGPISVTNPICPACYSDTKKLPIDGLKYYSCVNCKHSFAGSNIKTITKITKRNIFNQIKNRNGLFDPFEKFNGTKSTINKILNKLDISSGEIVSNYDLLKNNFSINTCELYVDCDIFESILKAHKNINKSNNTLSLCFIPFYNDIDDFITICYKNTRPGDKTIVLANPTLPMLKCNIGQVHHFTSKSLHYILSSQQKNYDIFAIDKILGFIIY